MRKESLSSKFLYYIYYIYTYSYTKRQFFKGEKKSLSWHKIKDENYVLKLDPNYRINNIINN